ncbi:MAG: hypothetical protein AAGA65_22070 [Actinomycetota bacterium]
MTGDRGWQVDRVLGGGRSGDKTRRGRCRPVVGRVDPEQRWTAIRSAGAGAGVGGRLPDFGRAGPIAPVGGLTSG